MDDLPPFVRLERDALSYDIRQTFANVSRQGGVTWNESIVMDLYGTDEDRKEARTKDLDAQWEDLIDDPTWRPDMGVGGWSFLDAVSFRYYLPIALVRAVKEGWDVGVCNYLTLDEGEVREWLEDKWSQLDGNQRRCVKRFLEYMSVVDPYYGEMYGPSKWKNALDLYWRDALE